MDTASAILIAFAITALTICIVVLARLATSQARMLMARTPGEAARAEVIARGKQPAGRDDAPIDPASRV